MNKRLTITGPWNIGQGQVWMLEPGSDSFNDKAKKKNICVFQVSRPYLGFCPNPKHFIVNCEQNVVKSAEKWGKMCW